jgi:hypothetical protein
MSPQTGRASQAFRAPSQGTPRNDPACDRRAARDGRARDRAPRRHGSACRHTTGRRPNRCAAHPEPFSYGMDMNGGARKKRDVGVRRRVSDKRPRQQDRPIGASSEGRLAWLLLAVLRPPLQGAPSAELPCRAFFRAPSSLSSPDNSALLSSPSRHERDSRAAPPD